MQFEYDPNKSEANLRKHGIDFEEAQELWCDEWRLTAKIEREGEERSMLIARYASSFWTAIYVLKGDAVRIISVRRSTKKEAMYYDRCRNEYERRA